MPAHLVPLVEIISAEFTDPEIAEGLVTLMKDLHKAPIWVKKDVPGFVGNRLQHAMMREALYLINDGIVDAEGVDTAVRYGFGFRFIACGPILQKEMSGWDTNYHRRRSALSAPLRQQDAHAPGEGVDRQGPSRHENEARLLGVDGRVDREGKSAHRALPAGRDGNPQERRREVREMVAGDGVEPPTQGFSVLCSTN